MNFKQAITLLLLIQLTTQLIAQFDDTTAQTIFTQENNFIIHVTNTHHEAVQQILNQYCKDRDNCTKLDVGNSFYEHITSFVGYQGEEYLLILDAQQHKKYILPIKSDLSQLKIQQFEESFLQGTLKPYYASQVSPLYQEQSITYLVGSTYEDFIVQSNPIKIIYIYADETKCETCSDLLEKFKKISKRYYKNDLISFGFINILKNDSRFIRDQIFPYFLIYVGQNIEDPYGVGIQQFQQLQGYIKRLLSDFSQL